MTIVTVPLREWHPSAAAAAADGKGSMTPPPPPLPCHRRAAGWHHCIEWGRRRTKKKWTENKKVNSGGSTDGIRHDQRRTFASSIHRDMSDMTPLPSLSVLPRIAARPPAAAFVP